MERDCFFNKNELPNTPNVFINRGFYDYMQNKVDKELEQYKRERIIQRQEMERERKIREISQY